MDVWPVLIAADSATPPAPGPADALNHLVTLQLLILTAGIVKISDAFGWILARREIWWSYREHIAKLSVIGLAQLQYAWASFYEYPRREWSILTFAGMSLAPLMYLFISDLLFPGETNLNAEFSPVYQKQIRLIAVLGAIAMSINICVNFLFPSNEPPHTLCLKNLVRGSAFLALLILFLTPYPKRRNWHMAAILTLLGGVLFYCYRLTPPIPAQ